MSDDHHHFLTRDYLEGFAVPQPGKRHPRLWAINGDGKCYATTPKDAAKIQHYYTLHDEGEPRRLEDAFGVIEAGTAPYMQSCRETPRLPAKDEREMLVAFVALHHLRVPHMRDTLQALIVWQAKAALALYADHPEAAREVAMTRLGMTEAEAEEVVEALQLPDEDFEVTVEKGTDLGPLVHSWGPVCRMLDSMHLHILLAEGVDFVTGDRPVCIFAPGEGRLQTGLGDAAVEVTFQLNRRACLVFRWRQGQEVVTLTGDMTHQVNYRLAAQSKRLLLGPDKAQLLDLHGRRR